MLTGSNSGERNVSNALGTIPIGHFDNSYFGLNFERCVLMDPMYRISLERVFEAVVDAGITIFLLHSTHYIYNNLGINPADLRGRRIAVYAAMTVGDNDTFYSFIANGHALIGHCRAMLPNRISYCMNLKGMVIIY